MALNEDKKALKAGTGVGLLIGLVSLVGSCIANIKRGMTPLELWDRVVVTRHPKTSPVIDNHPTGD